MHTLEYDEIEVEWFWPDVEIEIAAHLLEVEKMEHFSEDNGGI